MKFSEMWLREWVDPDISTEELAHGLTMGGHEVESVEQQGSGLDGVVVAEVVTVARHPDADRLSVCQVNTGSGDAVEVVCGAPNVVAGMKSPFAPPGVRLPNGLKLRKSKIRGVMSYGMLCSAVELGLGEESDGIISLPMAATVGQPLTELLSLPDSVIDIDVTPNRGDCLSVLGIARDVAAITGQPFSEPEVAQIDERVSDRQAVILDDATACPRFAGRVIRGINPDSQSPVWMVERLRRSGVRSIHPIVDITNFVMLELGQPLHAYDLARLQGPIRPRFARIGEKVVLLDEREIELNDDTVIITDDSGPIGVAGIMGGLSTAVDGSTIDVFFEAAFWPQDVIVRRARSYAMHTDASQRFERGVDPTGQARAINRATELLLEISGGKAGPLTDEVHADHLPKPTTVVLRHARLSKLLGTRIEASKVTNILRGLGLETTETGDGWTVKSPSFRFDIGIEEDLIEEVARIHGYDEIPELTATAETPLAAVPETMVNIDRAADVLVARDYQEVITYSFVDPNSDELITGTRSELGLANPISSEMSVMRGSLWTGMLASAFANVSRQQDRVRLFEVGKSFHGNLNDPLEVERIAGLVIGDAQPEQWGCRAQPVDFFDIKSDVEALLAMTGNAAEFSFRAVGHPALQPGQAAEVIRSEKSIGVVGKLHPGVAKQLGLRKDVFVFELNAESAFTSDVASATDISKFPAIRRDISVVVDDNIRASEIVKAVESSVPDLIQKVVIFDIYNGPGIEVGLKSVALGLILQETSRTLTDEDADSAMDAAVGKLQDKFAAVLRE